jgi:enamine deaminase RidA (YjgF/YER057c/UK114 family)
LLKRAGAGVGRDDAHEPAIEKARVLGTVTFGASGRHAGPVGFQVPLDVLDSAGTWVDVWFGRAAARVTQIGGVNLATDGYLVFGKVEIDETRTRGPQAAAREAYTSIFAALEQAGGANPLRFWNYVPHINQPLDGLERYRHFNIGRQEAFLAARRTAFEGAPAACAIGTEVPALSVYFVAAGDVPIPIENPRQVSAYHYPTEYGPRSPTFSRATLTTGTAPMLFISGTASVVGHRSMHPGDAVAQTRETFANLRTLVDAANSRLQTLLQAPAFALDRLIHTVYVRHPADVQRIRAQFEAEVGSSSAAARNAVFLRADICRADLLVEIEATGTAG